MATECAARALPSLNGLSADCNAESAALTWPRAEICVCALLVWVSIWSCCGFFLAATSWLTRLLTSRPDPIPAAENSALEELVEPTLMAMVVESFYEEGGRVATAASLGWLPLLLQQLQHALRGGVGLRQHRDTGLLQDVRAGHVGRLGREVGVLDLAARRVEVLRDGLQVGDGRVEAVLHRAQVAADRADRLQGRVDAVDRVVRTGHGLHVRRGQVARGGRDAGGEAQ